MEGIIGRKFEYMYLRGFLQGIPGKIHESFVLSVITHQKADKLLSFIRSHEEMGRNST